VKSRSGSAGAAFFLSDDDPRYDRMNWTHGKWIVTSGGCHHALKKIDAGAARSR
jgi:hypothetical protein